jgi:hypothetical protein
MATYGAQDTQFSWGCGCYLHNRSSETLCFLTHVQIPVGTDRVQLLASLETVINRPRKFVRY